MFKSGPIALAFNLVFLYSLTSLAKAPSFVEGKWIGFFNSYQSCSNKSIDLPLDKANQNQGLILDYKDDGTFAAQLLYSVQYIVERMKEKAKSPFQTDQKKQAIEVLEALTKVPNPEATHCVSKRTGTYITKGTVVEETLTSQKWLFCYGVEKQVSKAFGADFPGKDKTKKRSLVPSGNKDVLQLDATRTYREQVKKVESPDPFWKGVDKCLENQGTIVSIYQRLPE